MDKPLFSVVVIARNEGKHLPRLLHSLQDFRSRGGEVVVLDTGSTDQTVRLAKHAGCKVECVGDTFRTVFSHELADEINSQFIVKGEENIVKPGDSFFDFARARNYAASLASNDMVAMPDCDEAYDAFNIDVLNHAIENGHRQFTYRFVFSWTKDGKPDVTFDHSKFYDRRSLEWVGCVHEVLQVRDASLPANELRLPEMVIHLSHHRNMTQARSQYLTGLAYDCYIHPEKDRNSHYFARELLWAGRYRSAVKEFERHIEMNKWDAERAQSAVFIGEAEEYFGRKDAAILAYQRAVNICGKLREPLSKLAAIYFRDKDAQRCAIYASAALTIPRSGFYMDREHYYGAALHEMLYWAFYYLGEKSGALHHWLAARHFEPENERILFDARFVLELPKVTIVVPTLGREAQLARLQELIKENALYPNYEVKVMQDSFDDRQGLIKLVNQGVQEADSDYVMFLTNDCEPQKGFLIQAVLAALDNPGKLIALNDGLWGGKLATHWFAPKRLRERLNGNFFSPEFSHHGCDNFLTALCKKLGAYHYCERSRIQHNHPDDDISALAWSSKLRDSAVLEAMLKKYNLVDPTKE